MDTKRAIKAFDALSQETRLKAFRFLAEAGRDGVAAGVLAEKLKVPHNTLSFHLANLTQAGLIASKRKGRSIIYHARLDRVHELTQFMVEKVCVVDFMDVLSGNSVSEPDDITVQEDKADKIEETPAKKVLSKNDVKSDKSKKSEPLKQPEQSKKSEKTDKPEKATTETVKKLSKEMVKKAPQADDKGQMSMF